MIKKEKGLIFEALGDIKAIYHIVKLSGALGHEPTLEERVAAGVGNGDKASRAE